MSDKTPTTDTSAEAPAAPATVTISPEQLQAALAQLMKIQDQLDASNRSSDSLQAAAAAPVAAPAPDVSAQLAQVTAERDAALQRAQAAETKLAAQQQAQNDFELLKANVGHVLEKARPVKDVINFLESLL